MTMMESIAGYFDKIGVKTRIIKGEYTGVRTKIADDTLENPATVMYGGSGLRRFYTGFYNFYFRSDGTFHMIKDKKMDALIDDALGAETEDSFKKAASKLFREVYDLYLICPIVEIGSSFATNDKITGWTFSVADYDYDFLNLLMRK
jgi:ABC-type transport system substrate-binding protein